MLIYRSVCLNYVGVYNFQVAIARVEVLEGNYQVSREAYSFRDTAATFLSSLIMPQSSIVLPFPRSLWINSSGHF